MNLLNENMFAPIVARTEQVLVGTQLEFRLFFLVCDITCNIHAFTLLNLLLFKNFS